MENFNYSYTKENIKFLDQFHDYIVKMCILPEFYIINEEQYTFCFQEELSVEQQTSLNNTINEYIPPQSYLKTKEIQSLNISNDKVYSMVYVSIATSIYNNSSKLGSISIISNTNNNNNTYQIRIFDYINNTIIAESNVLNNTINELIDIPTFYNSPKNNTFIEIQVKLTNPKYSVNISAINFNFQELVQG